MAEFTTTNNNYTFILLSLFFVSKGLYVRINFDVIDLSNISLRKNINKKKVLDI